MAIKHTFTSPKSDGADSTKVRPSDWNSNHTIDAGTIVNADVNASAAIVESKLALNNPTHPLSPAQIVRVAKSGGDYTTIAAALAAITDATSTKQYVIKVAPGTYTESPFTMKSYVSLVAEGGYYNTMLVTDTNLAHFITGAANSEIVGCGITGPTSASYAAIYHNTTGTAPFKVIDVAIKDGYYGIWAYHATTKVRVHCLNVVNWSGAATINKFMYASGFSNITAINCWAMSGAAGKVTTAFECNGVNAEMTLDLCGARTSANYGLVVTDSTVVRATGCSFHALSVSGVVLTGAAYASLVSCEVHDCTTWDLSTANSSTLYFSGATDKDKISEADSSKIIAIFTDDTTAEEGLAIQGNLQMITGNINPGDNWITSVYGQAWQTQTGITRSAEEGIFQWDKKNRCLSIDMMGDCRLQVGEEMYIICYNNTAGILLNGKAVYQTGVVRYEYDTGLFGDYPTIDYAKADDPATSHVIGILTMDVPVGGIGFATCIGVVNDLDTSGWSGGDNLYLSAATAGALVTAVPQWPNTATFVGTVLRSNATEGNILVHIQYNLILSDLDDVNISALTANDVLKYNGTQWINTPFGAGAGIQALSGSNSSIFQSTLTFGNLNGLSFYVTNSSFVGSYSTGVGVSLLGNTSGTLAYLNSNTVFFAGGNNITLSQDGQSVTISGANVGGAQTGISGIAGSAASTVTAGTVQFANSNGVSFGLNGSTMTASVLGGGAAIKGSGTYTQNTGTVEFANSNNITFGLSTNQMTASFSQSVQTQGMVSINGNTGAIQFSNSNNVSFGINVSTVTASASYPAQTNQTISFAMTSNTTGNTSGMTVDARSLTVQGRGIISVGISTSAGGSSLVFSATESVQTQGMVSINGNTGAIVFSNSNNITFGINVSTVTASFSSSQSNQTLSFAMTGNTTANTSGMTVDARSLTFQGLGVASVGLSTSAGGSSLIVSVAGAGADGYNSAQFAASTANSTMPLLWAGNSNGSGNLTFGLTGSTVTGAAGAGAGVSMTGYRPFDEWMGTGGFSATNSQPGQNSLMFIPFQLQENLVMSRFNMYAYLSYSLTASNVTGSGGWTVSAALYARDAAQSDRITRMWSHSIYARCNKSSNTNISITYPVGIDTANSSVSYSNYGVNNATASNQLATSVSGYRPLMMPCYTTLTPGQYWLGFAKSTTTGATMTWQCNLYLGTLLAQNNHAFAPCNIASSASNAGYFGFYRAGTYATTSNAWPASITITNADLRNIPGMSFPLCDFRGYTTNGSHF